MTAHWSAERVDAALDTTAVGATATSPAGEQGRAGFPSVTTDSRSLEPGALFVALRGDHFDGHDFLADAARRGARGAVVDRRYWEARAAEAPGSLAYWVVEDTLAALGRLGRARRRAVGARVCAVTGTNGKTAVKEMARAVLGTRFRVHATTGNLNNLVGTPLTLLAAPEDAEAMVIEVATNAPGEIERLAGITEPDAAILTTVAEGHLEGLGGLDGVLEEKTSLLRALGPDSPVFVGEDPPELAERARTRAGRVRVAGWTERADADLRAADVTLDGEGRPRFRWAGVEVRVGYRGRHQVRNAMLALALGREWGIEPGPAARALAELRPLALRGEIERYGGLRVLVDCYNANPASTEAAARLLADLPRGGGRVAVLGSMLELGPRASALHRRTAERVAGLGLDLVVATGAFVDAFRALQGALGDRLVLEQDPLAAAGPLGERLLGEEVVLLKASRGVALERLLPALRAIGERAAGRPDAAGRPARPGAPPGDGEGGDREEPVGGGGGG